MFSPVLDKGKIVWFAALLLPVLIPGAIALWFKYAYHPTIFQFDTPETSAPFDPNVRLRADLGDGATLTITESNDVTISRADGTSQTASGVINAGGGRPVVATAPDGHVAVAWEEPGGSHHVGVMGPSWNPEDLSRSVQPSVFTTAMAAIGEDAFVIGGLDGRVRIVRHGPDGPSLHGSTIGSQAMISMLEGRIRFLLADPETRTFEAIGADGRRMTGRVDDTIIVVLRVEDEPVPGDHPALIRYSTTDSVVPTRSEAALQRFTECEACPEMIALPGGAFTMGSPPDEAGRRDDEGPQREVTVPAFAMARTEVTVAEYRRFVDATGHDGRRCYAQDDAGNFDWRDAADWQSPGFSQEDNHPSVCVSWDDAQAYVTWLNGVLGADVYRLPSEAEWEYAARAETQGPYYWGDDAGNDEQCGFANGADGTTKQRFDGWSAATCSDGYVFTAPVGTFQPNRFGLVDVSGNVWEWVQDCWHESYQNAPVDETPWLEADGGNCDTAVLRGGSWDGLPQFLRSAFRLRGSRDSRVNYIGFRLARTLSD